MHLQQLRATIEGNLLEYLKKHQDMIVGLRADRLADLEGVRTLLVSFPCLRAV